LALSLARRFLSSSISEIDDEVGVAVVFDEEEQESDEEEVYEIRDKSDDDEEGVEGDKDAAAEGEEEGEDALVIGGASPSKAGAKAKADKDIVSPHSIDAFWVQRLVGEVYTDPQTCTFTVRKEFVRAHMEFAHMRARVGELKPHVDEKRNRCGHGRDD
jgi:hypothetical protein